MTIDWAGLGQERFDRTVEVLLRDRFGPRVRAVNGKGGDGGVDIEIRMDFDLLWIVQLKYFETGFSGGFSPRRKQIKRSYQKAMSHQPSRWTLVVPCLCTTPEDEYVKGLNGGQASPVISVVDRDDLDKWMADAPHVEASVLRTTNTELERLARIFNQEKAAALDGVSDVVSRVRNLGSVVNSLHPEWAVGFAYSPTGPSSVSVQPRYPGAAISDPITFAVGLGQLSADLNDALTRSIGYGTSETVILPATAVTSVHISGGPFVSGDYPPGAVQLVTAPRGPLRGKRFEISASYSDNFPSQTFEGTITHSAPGNIGATVEADFCIGRLKVRLRIPNPQVTGPVEGAAAPGLDMHLEYEGARPSLVAEVLSTARLIRVADRIEISVDGQRLTAAKPSPVEASDFDAEMISIEQFAGDLEVIQRHTNRYFEIPATMSTSDRVRARVARLLIEGYIVAAPRARRLTMIMSGEDSSELRSQLTRGQQQIVWPVGAYTEVIDGRELFIGDVYAVHPRAVILNGHEAIAALDSGKANEFQVISEPADEPFFYVTMADVDQSAVVKRYLAAWTLHGIEQPGLPPGPADNFVNLGG